MVTTLAEWGLPAQADVGVRAALPEEASETRAARLDRAQLAGRGGVREHRDRCWPFGGLRSDHLEAPYLRMLRTWTKGGFWGGPRPCTTSTERRVRRSARRFGVATQPSMQRRGRRPRGCGGWGRAVHRRGGADCWRRLERAATVPGGRWL